MQSAWVNVRWHNFLCDVHYMCFRFWKCAHQLLGEQTPLRKMLRYFKHILALTQRPRHTQWLYTFTPVHYIHHQTTLLEHLKVG